MVLTELLKANTILADVGQPDKWTLIERLVDLLIDSGKAVDRAALLNAILSREKLGSTGLGNGIAIPHARTDGVREVAVALGISPSGMDFDAADGKPCHLIFLIVSPPEASIRYLEALAAVASLGEEPGLVSQLKSAKTANEVLALFRLYREQSE
ncbi:MAG TPA: PTS sugar transporter subunit IIA [Candidatus Hydrogenedentes bacterium]|jgi:mannitol/fructose-specific phosphotransferase system IIA component (Ntr-type)|nr:PTS sugar transporter subunit IIA [Candidatus Hydrogenedentota bacterium]HPJ98770.1 PTS sugar transporter subunit IIA [Candidatus Hydrogenedentota bacterium]